jgi:hypothetical protein
MRVCPSTAVGLKRGRSTLYNYEVITNINPSLIPFPDVTLTANYFEVQLAFVGGCLHIIRESLQRSQARPPPPMSIEIKHSEHGKGRVRLLKVTRRPDKHIVSQVTAEVLLEGPDRSSYVIGDNAAVLPTDTVKNTVQALAKKHDYTCIEELALLLAKHFVEAHPSVVCWSHRRQRIVLCVLLRLMRCVHIIHIYI